MDKHNSSLTFKRALLAFGLIILLGTLAYSNTFNAPFVLDDEPSIVFNPAIQDISRLDRIAYTDKDRLLTHVTFALNYHFGGLDVSGYHVVNLLLHLLTSCFVYGFTLIILKASTKDAVPNPAKLHLISLSTALLFVSHPMQTQAVTYIVQRAVTLSSCLYLGSLFFYARYRSKNKALYLVTSLCFGLLSMFSKQSAYTLPFSILVYEMFFVKPKGTDKRRGAFIPIFCFFLLLVITYFSIYHLRIASYGIENVTRANASSSRLVYFITQWNVIKIYLSLIFLPWGQNLDHAYPLSQSTFNAPTILSLVVLLLILFTAFKCIKQSKVAAFGLLWFFITISLESSIFPIKDTLMEHRVYLPIFGIALAVSYFVYNRLKNNKRFIAIMMVVIVTLSFLTYQRNALWTDKVSLWQDSVRKAPHNGRSHANLGKAYAEKKDYEKAITSLKSGIELTDGMEKTYVYLMLGKIFLDAKRYEESIETYKTAISYAPKYERSYFELAVAYIRSGKADLAKGLIHHLKIIGREDLAAIAENIITQNR